MIAVVDYGVCNIGSVLNMLKKIGVDATTAQTAEEIANAKKIILPGVGSYDVAMKRLRDADLIDSLNRAKNQGKYILGICLGMQLLVSKSEEGTLSGLCWIPGELKRFEFQSNELKVPHMGWNTLTISNPTPLFEELNDHSRFYFVHSYRMECPDEVTLAKTTYGKSFVSAIGKDNVMGVQFHPEKSHKFGMKLLQNFAGLR